MKEGDVVLTPFPQANRQVKNRPGVVLCVMPPFGDLLVSGISTRLHQVAKNLDELILSSDPDFKASGLRTSSLIRLGFLVSLPRSEFIGSIGEISAERQYRLRQKLSHFIQPTQ